MNIIEYAKLIRYESRFGSKKKFIDDAGIGEIINDALSSRTPLFVGRLGTTETFCIKTFLLKEKLKYGKAIKQLHNWSGFFPDDSKLIENFVDIEKEALEQVNIIQPMGYRGENYIISKYANKNVQYCVGLGCWSISNPWTAYLKGKKVLVIHPFSETIGKQYAKREKLFPNVPDMLPEFELQTIKAVQTIAGQKDDRFSNWFEALDWLRSETLKYDYDVALIGCGAYGFPLGAFCKKQGKVAIHMGGDLQMQFGIMGSRWNEYPHIQDIINEHWVRPSENEIVRNASVVEDSCYW